MLYCYSTPRWRVGLVCAVLFGSLTPSLFADGKSQRFEYRERHMGVDFKLKLYARDKPSANAAAKAAFRRVSALNATFSDYDADSELRRLCRNSGPGKPVKVSRELYDILQKSLALSKQTDGGFDVTVGHLSRLWRRARRRKEFPKADALNAALAKTGYRSIRLNPKRRTVELLKSGMRLDLGGIAKGYAGDEALKLLKTHGISRAMIDASGDIVVGDPPPGKDGWVIVIAPLKRGDKSSARFLTLKNVAVATSGDAYQYVVIGGKRYSHILNPKTGLGLTERSSVTVIAANGTDADSFASAVSVLGPDSGVTFAARQSGVEVSVTFVRGEESRTSETCGFSRYVKR